MTNAHFGIGRIGSLCIARRRQLEDVMGRVVFRLHRAATFLPINLHMQVSGRAALRLQPMNPQT